MSWKWPSKSWIVAGVIIALLMFAAAYRIFFHATPVDTAAVRDGTLNDELHGPGTVQARIPVTVGTRITGVIATLHADQGDAVQNAQLLATLDDRDLVAKAAAAQDVLRTAHHNVTVAEASLEKARSDLVLARNNYQRESGLMAQGFISEAAMDSTRAALRSAESGEQSAVASLAARKSDVLNAEHELHYADAQRSYAKIVAPMDGIIIGRDAEVGDTVVPGSAIFRMVDPRTLWVATRIDESVVGRAAVGQSARIRLRTGGEMGGKVVRIVRQSDAATRELEVDVAFDSPPRDFAIDQEAEVTIMTARVSGLVAPASALVQHGGVTGVLVVREGHARFQPVKIGVSQGSMVIVTEGLLKGELIITKPQNIRPDEHVRPVTQES
jgi:HlyD family secretion protein